MESAKKSAHVTVNQKSNAADWIRLIFTDITLESSDQATIELFQATISIEDQRVADACIDAVVRKFSQDAKARRRQLELLEFCLAQLRVRYQIEASPAPRLLLSEPERNYIDLSQVRFLPIISVAQSFIKTAKNTVLEKNWGHQEFSFFLLRLIFEQQILQPKVLTDVFARHYKLECAEQLFWLEHHDERLLISSDFSALYKEYAELKYSRSLDTLCTWLSKNVFGFKVNLRLLCKAAELKITLKFGVFTAQLAAGSIKTTQLSTGRWRQLLGQRVHIAVRAADDDEPLPVRSQRQWKSGTAKFFMQSADSQYRSLRERLRPLIDSSERARTAELTRLRDWLDNQHNADGDPWGWLLTAWAYWMFINGGKFKKTLRKGSIDRYLQFARPLFQSLGAQDVWEEHPEQWLLVIENAVNKAEKTYQAAAVERFVAFLISNGIAPDLDISDLELPRVQSKVDANMLSPAEVELVLIALRRFDSELTRIARLIFCFGFGCGLRRAEVLYLKKTNLRLDGMPYLALRHTIDRTLKSTRGRRNVPLELFWPEEELNLLKNYCQSESTRHSDLLFWDQKLALSALTLLTSLIKETAQQPNLVFHQLRHSFLNWCFWLLHLPRVAPKCIPTFFHHPWLGYNRAKYLRQQLGLAGEQLYRRDLHVFAALAGHSSPEVTLYSYVHISDLVNAALRSSNVSAKNQPLIYKTPEPDHQVLASATRVIAQALKTEQIKSGKVYPLSLLGQAIFQLSGSRHVKRKDHVPVSLLTAVQSAHDKNIANPKVCAVLTNVMRKKVPLRVIAHFNRWLKLLDDTQWASNFSQSQVEQIINLTDPGKDFLFICRTLDELALLVRWLEQLQISPQEIGYRLTLANRCHLYDHSQNSLHQIAMELESDLQAGLLKNLAAPKGRAKKRQPVNQQIEQSNISQQKLFSCEVHVRWDDIGNGVKRRNQALIGVLKAMWLSLSLREV